MSTVILRPDAAGDETNITAQAPDSTYHWDKVDEAVADDTGTYLINAEGADERDFYNLPACGLSGVIINSITIYHRAARSGDSGITPCLKTNGTAYEGTEIDPTTGWTTSSETWNINPDDSAAWEVADIDALQIGARLRSTGVANTFLTQIYVVIDYSAADPQLVTPTTLALVITTYTPTVAIDRKITPTTLALAITTYAPTVLTPRLVTPTTLALVITTYTPTVAIDRKIIPTTLVLALTTYAPTVSTPRLVTPATLALSLTLYAPTVSTPRLVTPGTLALIITTYNPTIHIRRAGARLLQDFSGRDLSDSNVRNLSDDNDTMRKIQ